MQILGSILALIIGVILGLIGGGGSILTVPLVHYVFDTSMLLATTYSLFVVTVAAGFGTVQRSRTKDIDFRQGVIFVIPGMLTALAIRGWLLPAIPDEFEVRGMLLRREAMIATLLVFVMMYTAIRTLTSKREPKTTDPAVILVVAYGVLTGLLSGLIGAGGGFIIVPILLRLGIPMKKAIGTSMFIITIQSILALIGDIFNPNVYQNGGIDWMVLSLITVLTVGGVFVGNKLQHYFTGKMLQKIFGVTLLLVSLGIAWDKIVRMLF